MADNMIHNCSPFIPPSAAIKLITEALENRRYSEGKYSKLFAAKLAEISEVEYCVLTTSGTTALTLSLMALSLPYKSRVGVSDYTMVASAHAIELAGLEPAFVDIDYDTLLMSYDYRETFQAVVAIHFNSNLVDIDKLAASYRMSKDDIIEDAACCVGMKGLCKGKAACLSFSAPKMITTGQGGAVLTNDRAFATEVRKLKDHGRTAHNSTDFGRGFNFKFNDISACLGISQLNSYHMILNSRRRIFNEYKKNGIVLRKSELPWLNLIEVEDAQKYSVEFSNCGIEALSLYPPLHTIYKQTGDFERADKAHKHILALPHGNMLSSLEIQFISQTFFSIKKI